MARLPALLGIVAISFSAILVRAADVSAPASAYYRVAYALPVLFLLWLATRGNDHRGYDERAVGLLAGAFLGVDLLMWHQAIAYIGAGLATVLGNLQVVFVGLLAWAVHGERPRTTSLLGVPIALAGLALTTGLGRADAYGSDPVLGGLLGLGTALAYAGFLLFFRYANRSRAPTTGPLLDATLGTVLATLLGAVFLTGGAELVPTWPAHGWLLLYALGPHVTGWLLIAHSLPRLPALTTSVLLLLQPVLTMVWGVLLFREAPSPVQWTGVALVLAGIATVQFAGVRART